MLISGKQLSPTDTSSEDKDSGVEGDVQDEEDMMFPFTEMRIGHARGRGVPRHPHP